MYMLDSEGSQNIYQGNTGKVSRQFFSGKTLQVHNILLDQVHISNPFTSHISQRVDLHSV